MTALKSRVSKLEERWNKWVEPEGFKSLSPQDQYLAMIRRPLLNRSAKPRSATTSTVNR